MKRSGDFGLYGTLQIRQGQGCNRGGSQEGAQLDKACVISKVWHAPLDMHTGNVCISSQVANTQIVVWSKGQTDSLAQRQASEVIAFTNNLYPLRDVCRSWGGQRSSRTFGIYARQADSEMFTKQGCSFQSAERGAVRGTAVCAGAHDMHASGEKLYHVVFELLSGEVQIVERSEGQPYVLAHIDNIVDDDPIYTTLGSGDNR